MITKFKLFEKQETEEDNSLVISAFPGLRLISGFPGIGKSHLFRVMQKEGIKKVLDSDSTNFSWIEKGVRNPNFPNNYIEHIKKNKDTADIILISSHDVVRNALVQNKIPFILVYPDRKIKDEYIARYRQRGSDENFVKLLEDNWDKFIDDCEKQKGCRHVVIHSGEYLSDKIDELMQDESIQESVKKTVTIPNMEKFIGKSRDEISERAIVYLQNKFKERIQGQQVKIKTLWDQDVEGKVIDVIFHIHSNNQRNINRITVKLYMEDGHNHNVRQGGKMYIIPEPQPRIRWFNRGNLEKNWD